MKVKLSYAGDIYENRQELNDILNHRLAYAMLSELKRHIFKLLESENEQEEAMLKKIQEVFHDLQEEYSTVITT